MVPFPESATLTLWLGLALFLLIEAVVVIRLVARIWAPPSGRDDHEG
jgi:hypothetical protein